MPTFRNKRIKVLPSPDNAHFPRPYPEWHVPRPSCAWAADMTESGDLSRENPATTNLQEIYRQYLTFVPQDIFPFRAYYMGRSFSSRWWDLK